MNEKEKRLSSGERELADQVADEILTVHEEEDDRRYFLLLLLFLICLIFLVSTVSFAVFTTYDNGISSNAIDVGVNVGVNKCTKNCDTDGDGICDKYCDNVNPEELDKQPNKEKNNDKKPEKKEHITPGTILFSYNEGSNYIYMTNVFPMLDSDGKKLTGDKEYFDFNISVGSVNKNVPVTYEIVAVPINGNTLDENDIRVYLTEKERAVSINSNEVNTFSKLPGSKISKNGRVIFKKKVTSNYAANYIFRMWLSKDAKISKDSKKFACKIVVNGYYGN